MFIQRLGMAQPLSMPMLLTMTLNAIVLSLVAAMAQADSGPLNPALTNQLKPFSTDGCSNWFDGSYADPNAWRHCCVLHDKAYWIGGTAEQRTLADRELQSCVTKTGHSFHANYMYFWIRLGGLPSWPTPYRWGYGWNYFEPSESAWLPKSVRGYRSLTDEENAQVAELIPQADQLIADDQKAHPAKSSVAQQPKATHPSPSVVVPLKQ